MAAFAAEVTYPRQCVIVEPRADAHAPAGGPNVEGVEPLGAHGGEAHRRRGELREHHDISWIVDRLLPPIENCLARKRVLVRREYVAKSQQRRTPSGSPATTRPRRAWLSGCGETNPSAVARGHGTASFVPMPMLTAFVTAARPFARHWWHRREFVADDSDLGRRPPPALYERERGAPAAGLLEFRLALLSKRRELVLTHERQQLLLERGGELQRQAQVRVARGKRHDLGAHVSLDAELAQQLQVMPPGVEVAAFQPERLEDELDQALQRPCRRIEVPGARVGVLEHDRATGPREPQVRLHLLVRASQRRDLVAGMHEVERARLEDAHEEVVLDEADIAKALLGHEPVGRAEHRLVDVGPR